MLDLCYIHGVLYVTSPWKTQVTPNTTAGLSKFKLRVNGHDELRGFLLGLKNMGRLQRNKYYRIFWKVKNPSKIKLIKVSSLYRMKHIVRKGDIAHER